MSEREVLIHILDELESRIDCADENRNDAKRTGGNASHMFTAYMAEAEALEGFRDWIKETFQNKP